MKGYNEDNALGAWCVCFVLCVFFFGVFCLFVFVCLFSFVCLVVWLFDFVG